jgi:glycosyltransferase involved in cell wall biosynthesis/GR25 family glycosyltransferase involved in LPS biosynthesis
MTISVICACKNRNDALRISLSSWLNFKEISEIIVVDWNSDEPVEKFLSLDDRIKIIRVNDKKYFNQPQPLNLALAMASGDRILKLDTDYVINPYYNFFETYTIDDNSFVSGKVAYKSPEFWSDELNCFTIDKANMTVGELKDYYNTYSEYYKYLTGLLYITKENLLKVGGYNENLGKYYAYEDDELYKRLELLGLEHKKMYYDHRFHHMPHPDSKRTENFEGSCDEELNSRIRYNLEPYYKGEELDWQIDYAISITHIKKNEEIISKITEPFVKPKTKWQVQQIYDRYYLAMNLEESKELQTQVISGNKLDGFPTIYYMSLDESEDRRLHLHNQFASYGITDLVPIISKRFHECDDKVYGEQLHILDSGTIGCVVSHIKAIRKWYEETEDDYAFFCEDDLSLEPVQYWNFAWNDFVDKIPEDAECVQLCCIRSSQQDVSFRERSMYDWSVTAYIITRDYARKIIERYCDGDSYRLEIPGTNFYPMPETVLFYNIGKVYSFDLFVEEQGFQSTFTETANIEGGNKEHHVESYVHIIDWWKNNGKKTNLNLLIPAKDNILDYSPQVEFTEEVIPIVDGLELEPFIEINTSEKDLEKLLVSYALDPENPIPNFAMGLWYERFGHTAPALSYFLRAAERSTDDIFSYESLIHCHHCYDKQGTRDGTAISLLQQAMCLMPNRPEAYFLLARFHERRHQWNDCYKYASLSLSICEFDLPPLKTSVEYPGYFGLLFEKAVSAWWWGKTEESKLIFLDLYDNYHLDSTYHASVIENLKLFGIDKTNE